MQATTRRHQAEQPRGRHTAARAADEQPIHSGPRDQPWLTSVADWKTLESDNNAVWETSDSNVSFDPPRPGQKISILRGPLGSYFLRINGQVGVRGRRVG